MPGEKEESDKGPVATHSKNKEADEKQETQPTPVDSGEERNRGSEKDKLLTEKEKGKHRKQEEKKRKGERHREEKERKKEEKKQRENERNEKQKEVREKRMEAKEKEKADKAETKSAKKEKEKDKPKVEKDKKKDQKKDKDVDTPQKAKEGKKKRPRKKDKSGKKEGTTPTVRPGEIRRVERKPDPVELQEIEDLDLDPIDEVFKENPSPIKEVEEEDKDPEVAVDVVVKPKRRKRLNTGQRLVIVAAVIIALVTILALIIAIIVAVKMSESEKVVIHESAPPNVLPPDGQFEFKHAAVASDHTTCSEIGRDILKDGGSAVDAAIATALCQGVVQGQSSGIGGGFFMTIYDKESGERVVVDATATAPQAATRRMCSEDTKQCEHGPRAVGVPGAIRGYKEAHSRFGVLPWRALFEPAIRLAERGFTVTDHLADALSSVSNDTTEAYLQYTVLWLLFSNDNVELPWQWYRKGENMTRPALAVTLRRLAEYGANDFYHRDGLLAQKLINDITEDGGIMTVDDLENYQVKLRETLDVQLQNNYTVSTAPPPAAGAPLLFLLNFMEDSEYLIRSSVLHRTTKLYNHFIEACMFALDGFSRLGDPGFVNITSTLNELISESYADEIRSSLHNGIPTFDSTNQHNYESTDQHSGSTHISVIAENGDAVSMTSSINSYFGSRYVSKSTGVILNNHMNTFTTVPVDDATGMESPNYIEGGKRPRFPMAPSIVLDNNGNVTMVIGGAGANAVVPSIAMVVLQTLLSNQTLAGAVKEKRLSATPNLNKVLFEKGFSQTITDVLQMMGYDIEESRKAFATVHAILVDDDVITASKDPRNPGVPAGY